MKVLLVTPLPPPFHGGIVNWSRIVRQELAAWPELDPAFVDTAVRWRSLTNLTPWLRLVGGSAQALRDVYRLRRQLQRERPDVVHVCTSAGLSTPRDLLMLRVARGFRVPSVIQYHMGRMPEIIARGGWEWRLIRRAVGLADCTVVLDRQSEDALRAVLPQRRVSRLPNMVELELVDRRAGQGGSLPPVPPGAARIVFAGHVIPSKGVRELVEACLRIPERPWVLEVLGVPDEVFQRKLAETAAAAGQAHCVRFHGFVEHDRVLEFLAAADLFVLPSYTEGAPYVVIEAMACRAAVLASAVGAIPEILDVDGAEPCGVCVRPQDVAGLAEALIRLLDDPQERRQLGQRGRRRAEQLYGVPVVCQQLVALWQRVLPSALRQERPAAHFGIGYQHVHR